MDYDAQQAILRSLNTPEVRKSNMEFVNFVRKPFVVEAVEITVENIAEVAKYVGEIREKDDGTPFIFVDRRLVPNVFRVYPGYFMTRMNDHIRCYTRKIFMEQFVEADPSVLSWVEFLNGDETVAVDDAGDSDPVEVS